MIKSHRTRQLVFGLILFSLLPGYSLTAQEMELRRTAPNVFLDCERRACDMNYIRTEITFVNYMRDRENANIHVMVTRRRTGSGGYEYTLNFIGLKTYKGKDATLKYFSKSTDTEAQVREGLVNILKQGLIPYISDTPLAEYISISYQGAVRAPSETMEDKWNYWVFSAGLSGNLNMEDLSKRYNYSLSLSANRTTENWKFRFWTNSNHDERRYEVENEGTIISIRDRKTMFTQLIKSLDNHWSAGIFARLYSSTYDNADLFGTFGPAVEFNIFPYEESMRRELRIQYRINYNHRNYYELTIFDKTQENLFQQAMEVILEIKEPWGSAGAQLEGSTFLHDFSKNNLKFQAGMRLRVFKGLSFNVHGEYSRVRDQLSLPKESASKDEILLELKNLAKSYDLQLRMGFSYRFGSIYNNIVNPRFGNM
jgi:hypothetical protein